MTQYQYDTIIRIVENGAPALAQELCSSLSQLVNERNELVERVKELEVTDAKEEA